MKEFWNIKRDVHQFFLIDKPMFDTQCYKMREVFIKFLLVGAFAV